MSVRSQRLRAKTPTSYVKYNLDFDQSIDDEDPDEESSDTFQSESVKPAFSLKINRKLRQTLDLVDLSPNKDEEPDDRPKSILKTPLSTIKKTRKKASQFLPKVDQIKYDPTEPARKLVRAKRRLERQDHVEEECDKYFNFKIEEEIGATQSEEMATNDEHVLTEVKTRRSANNVQCELQVDNFQAATSAKKNGCVTPKNERESQLASSPNDMVVVKKEESPETPQNATSKTPKNSRKSGRFTTKNARQSRKPASSPSDLVVGENEEVPETLQNVTRKSSRKSGRFTTKSGRESQKLASSPSDLVVAENEKSPETPQNVASKTPKSARKSGRFTTKSGRKSQRLAASSPNDLVLAKKEKSPETQQNVAELEHTLEIFEDETEALPADSTTVTRIVEYEAQSRVSQLGNKSQKCDTPVLNGPDRILSNNAVKNERSPLKSGRSQKQVESASSSNDVLVAEREESIKTPKNVAKAEHVFEKNFERETGDLQADTMVTQSDTPQLENCRFSIPKEQEEKSTKKSVENNRFSTATEIVEVESTTLKSVEKKRQTRTSKISSRISQKSDTVPKPEPRRADRVDEAQKQDEATAKNTPQSAKKNTPKNVGMQCNDTFTVNESPQNKKSTKQTPKSGNKSNHQTNIPGNERNGTENSFDMFDNSMQGNSMQADTTFNVEETLTVSRENSIKTYGKKSKDLKRNSKQNSTFEKENSLISTPQAATDFNIGKEEENKVNVTSGKQRVSLNKSSTGSKSNRDSMQLDRSSSRSTSLSKTPRNKMSEVSSALKRTTPSSVARPKRESIISRKRWSMRSNSFCMHLTDNDSINLISPRDVKRKMSLNTPDNARNMRQGSLRQNVLRKSSIQNTPLREKVVDKSLALIRNSGSSTPITEHNQFEYRTSIFDELSMSEEPTDLLDTTTPPNDISYEPDTEEVIATEDSTIKPKKRRTFELDSSVNDISTLKLVSKRDSKRMSGVVKRSSISTPSSANRKFNGSTIVLDDSSFDSSNSVIFVGEYFENKKSTSLNDVNNGRKEDESFDVPIERFQKRRSRSLDNVCRTAKKSSMFFMPGQHVSTPMPKNVKTRKDSLLKRVLSATKAAQSVSAKKPVVKARNMPNFALIHQRAFDKMEDIAEHKQRKDERARDLLSGKKPPNNDEMTPQRSSSIKKKLRFADDTAEKEKPADFIPLPNTPRPRKTSRRSSSVTSSSKKSTPQSPKSKIAIPNFAKNLVGAFQGNKENDAGLKNAWKPPVLTKFGFAMKAPSKPIKEREEVKAVIEKTRAAPVNDPKKRRNLIKGVRSNRRFDLLMQMRNKRE